MDYEGSSSIISSSIVSCNGEEVNPQYGSCSIISVSLLELQVDKGKASIISEGVIAVSGLFLSIADRVEALAIRIDDLEEQINAVPEGTDFLTPEDVQPLFNEREVIFDV